MPKNRQLLKRALKKKNLAVKDLSLSSSRVKLSLRFFYSYFLKKFKKSSDFSKLEKKFNVWFFKRNPLYPLKSSITRKINNLKLIVRLVSLVS